jgi:hypothetical protein
MPLSSAVHPSTATSSSFLPSHPLTFTSISFRSLNCHTHSAVISNYRIHQLLMPSAQIQLSHPSAILSVKCLILQLLYIFYQRGHMHQVSFPSVVPYFRCHIHQLSLCTTVHCNRAMRDFTRNWHAFYPLDF